MRVPSCWWVGALLCGGVGCGRTESDPDPDVEPGSGGTRSIWPARGGTAATLDAGPSAGGAGVGPSIGGASSTPDGCGLLGSGPDPAWASGYRVTGYLAATPVSSGPISDLVAEDDHTCAMEAAGGAVWCWGFLPERTGVELEAALSPTRLPELDGSLGDYGELPGHCSVRERVLYCGGLAVPELDDVVSVANAGAYACVIRSAGDVWCWGSNDFGRLGSDADGSSPVQVPGVSRAVKLDLTRGRGCALLVDGRVTCWGTWDPCSPFDCVAPVGEGLAPHLQSGLPPAVDVAQAEGNLCVLTAAGDVWCRASTAATANPPTPYTETVVHAGSGVSRLVMGNAQLCTLASDHVACWGGNFFGAVGNGTWQNAVPCPTPVLEWPPDP